MKLLRLVVKSPLKHLLGKLGIIIPLKYGWKSKLTPNISLRLVVYMHILSPLIIPIIHDYTSWYPHHIPTVSLYPYSLNGYTVTHVHVFFICFNHQTDLKSEPNHQWRVVQFPRRELVIDSRHRCRDQPGPSSLASRRPNPRWGRPWPDSWPPQISGCLDTERNITKQKHPLHWKSLGKQHWKIIEIMELGIHWKILEDIGSNTLKFYGTIWNIYMELWFNRRDWREHLQES